MAAGAPLGAPDRAQRLAAALTFNAAASTRVTPLMPLAVVTALSFSAWVATAPLRLTTPFTVSTLISVPGTLLLASRAAFTLLVIQVSVTGSLESWRSAWVAGCALVGGLFAAGSLANAAEEDSARPSVRAEAISVRVVLLIVSYSFGMCCQSGQADVEQAWRCGHAAVN